MQTKAAKDQDAESATEIAQDANLDAKAVEDTDPTEQKDDDKGGEMQTKAVGTKTVNLPWRLPRTLNLPRRLPRMLILPQRLPMMLTHMQTM